MKKLVGLILFVLAVTAAFAQKQERALVQFSGVVHNADSTVVIVPYVSIVNSSSHAQVYQSNYKGYFSIVVHELDTVRFSCVGYNSLNVVIPANIPSKAYDLNVMLKPQIINLPVFRVFPWATTEEFTKEFLSMRLADDDLAIIRKNLSHASIESLERTLPRDAFEMNTYQNFHNNVMNSHSITNPLLNPFSWGNLIREISEGDKSRSADAANSTTPASTTGN
jgi:hypothetical protein